jgi:hypothetical protein
MVAQAAFARRPDTGIDMSEQLTPRQMFCAPLLSALIFGGGTAGIADIYVHIRDIVALTGRDWEPNPLERRLARWHSSIARAIGDFVKLGIFREAGSARWTITEKGLAVAKDFNLMTKDGVLIERALLRKSLDNYALEFEKMYVVLHRPNPPAAVPSGE